jgi:hypothetical protein
MKCYFLDHPFSNHLQRRFFVEAAPPVKAPKPLRGNHGGIAPTITESVL